MQKTPLLILVTIMITVGVVWFVSNDETAPKTVSEEADATPIETLTPMHEDQNSDEIAVMDDELVEVITESPEDSAADAAIVSQLPATQPQTQTAGTYTAYSPEKVASAEGDIVLFFKADWCPSCRALDADIRANLKNIPADVTILEVDYDTQTELRQKYEVTTQHSLVHIDNNGTQIKKWSGSPRLESIVAEL